MSMIGSQDKNDLNFELNLLPIFDILSVCICFLLMTVVWIEVASMKASQSVGAAQGPVDTKESLTVRTINSGDLEIEVKSASGKSSDKYSSQASGKMNFKLTAVGGESNWGELGRVLSQIHQAHPKLITGIIAPSEGFEYGNLIRIMDEFKRFGIRDMGISPM